MRFVLLLSRTVNIPLNTDQQPMAKTWWNLITIL